MEGRKAGVVRRHQRLVKDQTMVADLARGQRY